MLKRTISLTAAVALFLGASTTLAAFPGQWRAGYGSVGDLNGDGRLDGQDLSALENVLRGAPPATLMIFMDVNRDYRVDIEDLAELARQVTRGAAPEPPRAVVFKIGDLNGDQKVDFGDRVALIHYLSTGTPFRGPLDAADVNCDGRIDVSDLQAL